MSRKKIVAQILTEYGDALRGDWSDFDGRTAKHVLQDLAAELTGKGEPRTLDQHRLEIGLCRDGAGHWSGKWGHCATYECPTFLKEMAAEEAQA